MTEIPQKQIQINNNTMDIALKFSQERKSLIQYIQKCQNIFTSSQEDINIRSILYYAILNKDYEIVTLISQVYPQCPLWTDEYVIGNNHRRELIHYHYMLKCFEAYDAKKHDKCIQVFKTLFHFKNMDIHTSRGVDMSLIRHAIRYNVPLEWIQILIDKGALQYKGKLSTSPYEKNILEDLEYFIEKGDSDIQYFKQVQQLIQSCLGKIIPRFITRDSYFYVWYE